MRKHKLRSHMIDTPQKLAWYYDCTLESGLSIRAQIEYTHLPAAARTFLADRFAAVGTVDERATDKQVLEHFAKIIFALQDIHAHIGTASLPWD